MSPLHIVGVALMVLGVVEFVVFRLLASSNENLQKALPFLMASSAFSVVLGVVFLFV